MPYLSEAKSKATSPTFFRFPSCLIKSAIGGSSISAQSRGVLYTSSTPPLKKPRLVSQKEKPGIVF
jgi:hypothetical protein